MKFKAAALWMVIAATVVVAGGISAATPPPLVVPDGAAVSPASPGPLPASAPVAAPSLGGSTQISITQRPSQLLSTAATDQHGTPFKVRGMSGVTWLSGEAGDSIFAVVIDNSDKVVRLRASFKEDGSIASLAIVDGLTLEVSGDHEGIAFAGGANNSVFVSDEGGPAINEFDLGTGALLRSVAVPSVFTEPGSLRSNLGLESLARCPETGNLWSANEEALTVDGERSTPEHGTLVRLTRTGVGGGGDGAAPDVQYVYLTEPLHGAMMRGGRSGVSDVVAISGGRLLVLERSFASGEGLFKNSIYLVDPAEGIPTDVAGIGGLEGAEFVPVGKRLVWSGFLNQNLEGLCLGPRVSRMSWVLLGVVDDGDPLSVNMVMSFELRDGEED